MRAYVGQVALATVAAATCFVAWPLRYAFDRPVPAGWLGPPWRQFLRSDAPLNELPSLHVALLVIVAPAYLRATRGPVRVALLIWFGLIGVSPLLVHQHHLLDLLAGLALGLVCRRVIPVPRPTL